MNMRNDTDKKATTAAAHYFTDAPLTSDEAELLYRVVVASEQEGLSFEQGAVRGFFALMFWRAGYPELPVAVLDNFARIWSDQRSRAIWLRLLKRDPHAALETEAAMPTFNKEQMRRIVEADQKVHDYFDLEENPTPDLVGLSILWNWNDVALAEVIGAMTTKQYNDLFESEDFQELL